MSGRHNRNTSGRRAAVLATFLTGASVLSANSAGAAQPAIYRVPAADVDATETTVQPGLGGDDSDTSGVQPGLGGTEDPAPAPEPEPAPAPAPEPEPQAPSTVGEADTWVPAPEPIANAPLRDEPDYFDGDGQGQAAPVTNTAPTQPSQGTGQTQSPQETAPPADNTVPAPQADPGQVVPDDSAVTDTGVVRPIRPPEDKLRIGFFESDVPWYVSDEAAERTNYTASWIESGVSQYQRDQGIEGSEADKRAAATVTAGAGGALAGGLAGGAGVGAVSAAACAPIGAGLGGGLGNVIIPGIGAVPGFLAGGAAAAGACGAAGFAAGATAGAALAGGGAALAANTFGAGEVEPVDEFVLPDVPRPDAETTYAATADMIGQLDRENPDAAQTVRDTTAAAEAAGQDIADSAEQAREAVAEQPGGDAVLAGLDQAGAEAEVITGPAQQAIGEATGAAAAAVSGDPAPAESPPTSAQPSPAPAISAPAPSPADSAAEVSGTVTGPDGTQHNWRASAPKPVVAAVDAAPAGVSGAVDDAADAVGAALAGAGA